MITAADVRAVAFPKEQRAALIAAEPDKFALPRLSDQRFHWVHARMAALDPEETRELVIDAWRMVVPKKVAAAHLRVREIWNLLVGLGVQ
jgi:hypothetical protein